MMNLPFNSGCVKKKANLKFYEIVLHGRSQNVWWELRMNQNICWHDNDLFIVSCHILKGIHVVYTSTSIFLYFQVCPTFSCSFILTLFVHFILLQILVITYTQINKLYAFYITDFVEISIMNVVLMFFSHPNLLYTNVLQRRISCSWSLPLELGSHSPILHLITHRSEILKQVQYKFAA